jgi:hypothetical protein
MTKYDSDVLREKWQNATAELPYGVQRAFKDVLELVAEEKKKDLVYGADYTDKGACLVNSAANMLVVGGGHGIPMAQFSDVVSLFDTINQMFYTQGVNSNYHMVSPLAAEILCMWYAPLKDVPPVVENWEAEEGNVIPLPYIEATDEEMEQAFMTLLNNRPVKTPFDDVEHITTQ